MNCNNNNFTTGLDLSDSEYNRSLQFLYSQLPMFSRVGAAAYKPGLDTSIALDNLFGNPHRHFKSIHIGGTNGKGSTSHNIASILQAQGYKVGLYTSPHLVDFRERIRVNGKMIPKEKVVDFVNRWNASDHAGLHPSFFELTMMMAFRYFADEKVDYAVIEVGMGGRLDSTNIITPIATVITNISKDHTQFLGATLPAIAAEKAGIIKHGIPVVIGEAEGEVREVFRKKAEEVDTQITFAEEEHLLTEAHPDSAGGWKCEAAGVGCFESPLGGEYQLKNINTVLSAIRMLRNAGVKISVEAERNGFRDVATSTGLMGRWTVESHDPVVICDTGHNIAGLTYNMGQLERMRSEIPGRKLHLVMGFVADKAIDEILEILPKDAEYYITNASIPRALPANELAEKFKEHGISGKVYGVVAEAVAAAKEAASGKDVVYIGGSTFVVADYLATRIS